MVVQVEGHIILYLYRVNRVYREPSFLIETSSLSKSFLVSKVLCRNGERDGRYSN